MFDLENSLVSRLRPLLGLVTLCAGLALSGPAMAAAPPVANDDAFSSNTSSAPTGGPELVLVPENTLTSPAIDLAATANGGFFLVWEKYRGAYIAGVDNTDLYGQIFSSGGAALSGQLELSTGVAQDPAVSLLDNDGFAATWGNFQYCGHNCYSNDVRTRAFSATAATGSTTVVIDNDISSDGFYSDVATLSGGYIVVWLGSNKIYARRFDNSGIALGPTFEIATVDGTSRPGVAPLAGGGFVLTWSQNLTSGADTEGSAILARQYDAAGTPTGAAFVVNTTTALNQTSPTVAGLNDGGFVIAWTHSLVGGPDIRAQRYDSGGSQIATEFTVNVATAASQIDADIAPLSDGGFVVSWSSDGTTTDDPDGYGVR